MFGLFGKPSIHQDARLGALERKRGHWRGTLALDGHALPLALAGERDAPDARAVAAATRLLDRYAEWQPVIARALFEHSYQPLRDGGVADLPDVAAAEAVWRHVEPVFVAVLPISGELLIEIGFRAAWDDEHTLGARLRDGELVELNGSVLAP